MDALSAGLQEAERALAGLGPRPPGDPAALRVVAKQVRREADATAAAGRLEVQIPGTMVFEGPAAQRFADNAQQIAESLFVAQRALDAAALDIERKAQQIATAQAAWDRSRTGLIGQVAAMARKLENAAP